MCEARIPIRVKIGHPLRPTSALTTAVGYRRGMGATFIGVVFQTLLCGTCLSDVRVGSV